jgi:hypothetical protein
MHDIREMGQRVEPFSFGVVNSASTSSFPRISGDSAERLHSLSPIMVAVSLDCRQKPQRELDRECPVPHEDLLGTTVVPPRR